MERHAPDPHPGDLDGLATELRALHADATSDELERARRRAWARSRGTATRRRPLLAPARVALVSVLAGAFLMAGSGATLALSGISSSGSAGKAQYPLSVPPPEVLPDEDSGGGPPTLELPDDRGALPDTESGGGDPVQVERQVASAGSGEGVTELPFTGLAALPVLILGCVLMAIGLAVRRGTTRQKRT